MSGMPDIGFFEPKSAIGDLGGRVSKDGAAPWFETGLRPSSP